MISLFVPNIIPVVIRPINPLIIANEVGVQGILSPCQTVHPKASVTDAAHSCARIFRGTPGKVNWTGRDNTTPRDVRSYEKYMLISPRPGSNPNSFSPARFRNQEVISPSHPSITKRFRNAKTLDTPIDGHLAINSHSTSYFSGVIGLEAVSGYVADVNARERMKFASNSVLNETPKFVDLGLLPANTADKPNSAFATAT